jgi:NAD(P)-dependent dehydrogenase (short-subunit alcohol dehydrogenase family)
MEDAMKGPRRLAERVIVVLGGGSGIGAATARLAAHAGARVVVADRRSALRRTPSAGHCPIVRRADVTDAATLIHLRDEVAALHGRIDAVVNCAAILDPGPVATLSWESIRRQFEVNALGTALVSTVFLPLFLTQRSGHLVLVSSLGGITPLPESAAYSATKFAVRGWGLALAEEVKPFGIEVTVVCPDSTDTPQLLIEAQGGGAPLSFTSKPMTPEKVARAILSAIMRPRRELCIPGRRGWLCKLAGASQLVFRLAYPLLRSSGIRARARFASARHLATAPGVTPSEVTP